MLSVERRSSSSGMTNYEPVGRSKSLSSVRLLPVFALALWISQGTAGAGPPQSSVACVRGVQEFWQIFRAAALKSQTDTLADLSAFPFEVRGTLDESTTQKLTRAEFVKRWPSLLNSDPGMSPRATSMRVFVKAHARLRRDSCEDGGRQFRVGNWIFQNRSDSWRFVRAFVED